jgi:release factor glutamine methyltransferase
MKKIEVWRSASERLLQAGKTDARFEAELLLRSALGEDRARFLASLEETMDAAALAQFERWIEGRLRHVPVQHLLGQQEFMGLPFEVTPQVLIPRPDTEVAVEVALERISQVWQPQVADIATGSGAIAIAVAKHCPRAQVWATDVSLEALLVAQRNAVANQVAERVVFRQSSWGEALLEQGLRFHCLVSNLPYIPSGELQQLMPEVQQEPRLALDGGPDGLECYRQLIPQAWQLLLPLGSIVLEVGQGQADLVSGMLQQHGFTAIDQHSDLAGIPRVVVGTRPEV